MIHKTTVSRDYLKTSKYHEYKKYSFGMLIVAAVIAVIAVVSFIYPYYNGNTNHLTVKEFQNSILTIGGVLGGAIILTVLFFVLAKLELQKLQKEELEEQLHGEQKEKENIENFNPFI